MYIIRGTWYYFHMTFPPELSELLQEIEKPARDLAALVQAFQAGTQTGVPAATAFELGQALDKMQEDVTYAGDLLGVAITFIADSRSRELLKQFGLELGE